MVFFTWRIKSLKKIKGVFFIIGPAVLVTFFIFSMLVIDLGIMRVARADLQTATDAAALAAANNLIRSLPSPTIVNFAFFKILPSFSADKLNCICILVWHYRYTRFLVIFFLVIDF